MRRLAMCMVLAFSLLPAGAALSKEPVRATICGTSDCRTIKDRDVLMGLNEGGPPTHPPKRGAPWYSMLTTIQIGDDQFDQIRSAIVPSLGLLRGGDAGEGFAFLPATDRATREYRSVTRGLAPFPAATLKGVGAPKLRVDEVVLPAAKPDQDGGSSPLPWIAGGVLLLGLGGLLIRRS